MRLFCFALLIAVAGSTSAQPPPAEQAKTAVFCMPCDVPCNSTQDCVVAVAVDPCAPGQAHTPDQCPALDDDADALANAEDRCPLESGLPETGGCPPTDADEDGIADHLDRCLLVKGVPEAYGCPPPDADADGIADALDRCPDEPGIPAEEGCPPALAQITPEKIEIKEKVFFETGKATIQPQSYAVLDDVAALLVANEHLETVVIEGHTDSTGSEELNRRLSQARAEAVRAYLIDRNVDGSRLEARGIGPAEPVATNRTATGREANRRVEFMTARGE